MSNAATFKRILSKQVLTGADVGRLFIIELIMDYQNFKARGGDPTRHTLTDAERQTLVNRLSREEFIVYLKYKDVHEYLKHLGLSFSSIMNLFTIDALQLDNQIISTLYGECERQTQRVLHPTVITQKQYDEMWKKHLETEFSASCSYENIFYRTYEYYRDLYNAGKKTPLDAAFKKWKKLPQNLVEWMDAIENQETEEHRHKGRSVDDFFNRLWRYYYSDLFVSKDTFRTLMIDLPELFKAVSSVMTKELPELKKVPASKYVTYTKASSWKKLYEKDYCGTKAYIDGLFDPHQLFPPEFKGGIAILHEPIPSATQKHIDENGSYNAPLLLFDRYRVEHLLNGKSETCSKLHTSLNRYGRSLFAYHELIKRMSKALKVEGIEKVLPSTEETERIFNSLNHNKNLLLNSIQPNAGRNVPVLKKKLIALLPDFDVEELKTKGIAEIDKMPPLTVDFLADNIYYYSNKLLRGEEL